MARCCGWSIGRERVEPGLARSEASASVSRVLGSRLLASAVALALAACSVTVPPPEVSPAADPHGAWRRVIEQYIDARGCVDFTGLRRDPTDLHAFVAWIALPETDVARSVDRQAELAFALNAHAALSLYVILQFRGGSVEDFYESRYVSVRGRSISLRELEEHSIAPFGDARAKFALGWLRADGPRLPREPFTAANLDRQLDAMMREFVDDRRHVEVHASGTKVRVGELFLRHADAIRAHAPDVVAFCNLYRSTPLPIGTLEYRLESWRGNFKR